MTRFETTIEKHYGQTIYLLRDLQTGASARIIPAHGANCMELKLSPEPDAPPVTVIDDSTFIPKLGDQPSRYGIPILYPWPSGIPGGAFQFENKVYHLNEPGEKQATHHGFVNTAAWRVVRSDCDNTGAWLTCEIHSKDCTGLADRYPFSCMLLVTWRFTPDSFQILMQAKNTGSSAMPMGIGLHPYFTIPFGTKGSRQECRLTADVDRQWNLDVTTKVEPGEAKPEKPYHSNPEFDAAPVNGTPLADVKFNHVFEAKFDQAKTTRASVIDAANDVRLTVSASRDFGTWVFYTPPGRNVISLEPWTLTPNGFNLAAAGVNGTGIITLQPNQTWNGQVEISIDANNTAIRN